MYVIFWFNYYDVKTSDFITINFQVYTISNIYKIYKSYNFFINVYNFYLYDVYLAEGRQETNANNSKGRKNCIYSVCVSCRWEALC